MKANRTSSNAGRHPYQKFSFWVNNRFWESPMYSQASRDYFNNWLAKWQSSEKSLVSLQQNIKNV